jgi:hypothetical protein
MDEWEAKVVRRHLERANPPLVLHRYRRPTEWTLAEIRKAETFAAAPGDLNDPFEYFAPINVDASAFRRQFIEEFCAALGISPEAAAKEFDAHGENRFVEIIERDFESLRNDSGVICLSAVPN